jgi:hypothetical protein
VKVTNDTTTSQPNFYQTKISSGNVLDDHSSRTQSQKTVVKE